MLIKQQQTKWNETKKNNIVETLITTTLKINIILLQQIVTNRI